MPRSKIKGIAAKQRALRALPAEAQAQFVKPLGDVGRKMAKAMQDKTPTKTGALKAGISYKVYATGLRLVVGLLGTAAGRSKLFYGRIQDLGRKAQTVVVQRARGGWATKIAAGNARVHKKTGRLTDTYALKVRAMEGKRFVTGSYPELRTELRQDLAKAYDQAAANVMDRAGD